MFLKVPSLDHRHQSPPAGCLLETKRPGSLPQSTKSEQLGGGGEQAGNLQFKPLLCTLMSEDSGVNLET